MITDPAELGTILGVWAHPDDEAYLSAAIMAAAVDAGQRVACITATRGELGSLDEARWPLETLAAVRTAELEACLLVLGVAEHSWLDFADGRCGEVPVADGVAPIAAAIEEVRPDTVLTFGPDGMTGHVDHIAVSNWTTEAVRLAGGGTRLLYATKTPEWGDAFLAAVEPDRVLMSDARPPATPLADMALHVRADDEALRRKYDALLCQESQVTPLVEAMGEAAYLEFAADEFFRAF